MKVKVPQLCWHNPCDLEMAFPDSWEVSVHNIAGYNRPAMSADQVKAAVDKPVGMPPIREMARDKKQAVIIFDDMTRSTRVDKIVPYVLEELAAAGIPDRNIRFMCALGTHAPMPRQDMVKKLGEAVVSRYAVYNHNAFVDLTHVGTTSRGNKVLVNTEVMNCDLKIAIGSVSPHPIAVFSGGGKMILPGVCARETVDYNHALRATPEENRDYNRNPRRLDMEEAANMVKVDVDIEVLVNGWGETCAMFVGTEKAAHAACVAAAREHYLAIKATDCDVVVSNAYHKSHEWNMVNTAAVSVRKGGDFVILANNPDGPVIHYLLSGWGSTLRKPGISPAMSHVKRVFLYNEYPFVAGTINNLLVQPMNTWKSIENALKDAHGAKAKVAVYPSADMMYFA